MYDNGKKLNHYAAKRKHQEMMKKRFTPKWYSSYEHYLNEKLNNEELSFYEEKLIRNGQKIYRERWWHEPTSYKHHLKEDAHMKERAFYRQLLSNLDKCLDNLDDDIIIPASGIFGDPWDWD